MVASCGLLVTGCRSLILTSPQPPATSQNFIFTATCTCRSVVPHSAHDGLASIAEMVPNAELPSWPLGLANCGWFRMLNASIRASVCIAPIFVFLINDRSTLKSPGPRTLLRPVLPNVPVESAVCLKHDVLNHCVIVGFDTFGSQIVSGRLFVMPVESIG